MDELRGKMPGHDGLWQRLWRGLLGVVYPPVCVYCAAQGGGTGPFLCGLCRAEIVRATPPFCGRCGAPAAVEYELPETGFICAPCRRKPPHYDRARSLGSYDTVLKKMIHCFKYERQRGLMEEIAPLLAEYCRIEKPFAPMTVVPVPLHPRKLRERGFDQAFLLARGLARAAGLPLRADWLRRVRETAPQASRSRKERWENVRGAFAVPSPDAVKGQSLLLVDDVLTTGATLNEAAKALKRAGAARVEAFTLARA